MKARLLRLLAHRAWIPAVTIVAVLLCVGSLGNGMMGDDHIHRMLALGDHNLPWIDSAPFDLYAIMPTRENNAAAAELGLFPWWGSPDMRVSFWRPLTSLTLYLDHQLLPDRYWLMHAHSLFWLALMCFAAAAVYRRFLGQGWLLGLTVALFVLDDAHLFPAAWLANRNALIATAPALLALVAHDRWRGDGWRPGAVLGPLALAVGLAGGEYALGVVAYLVSHAIFLDRARWSQRCLALLPYLVVIVVWRVAYIATGHGVVGSGMYVDPLAEPLGFARAAAQRLPLLVSGLFGPPGVELNVFVSPEVARAHIVVGAVWSLLVAAVLWPLLKRDRLARFWALGATLALVPVCATFAGDRLLLIAALGGMALAARLLGLYLDPPDWRRDQRWTWRLPAAVLAVVLVTCHLVVPPLTMPFRITSLRQMGDAMDRATASIRSGTGFDGQTVVIVNGPFSFFTSMVPAWRDSMGLANPARVESLCDTVHPVTVRRDGERSLTLRVEGGQFRTWLHPLFRQTTDRWEVGRRVERPGITFEALEVTDDGQVETVRVTFDRPLDDPSLMWVTMRGGVYVTFQPPSPGEAVVLDIDERAMLFPE